MLAGQSNSDRFLPPSLSFQKVTQNQIPSLLYLDIRIIHSAVDFVNKSSHCLELELNSLPLPGLVEAVVLDQIAENTASIRRRPELHISIRAKLFRQIKLQIRADRVFKNICHHHFSKNFSIWRDKNYEQKTPSNEGWRFVGETSREIEELFVAGEVKHFEQMAKLLEDRYKIKVDFFGSDNGNIAGKRSLV